MQNRFRLIMGTLIVAFSVTAMSCQKSSEYDEADISALKQVLSEIDSNRVNHGEVVGDDPATDLENLVEMNQLERSLLGDYLAAEQPPPKITDEIGRWSDSLDIIITVHHVWLDENRQRSTATQEEIDTLTSALSEKMASEEELRSMIPAIE